MPAPAQDTATKAPAETSAAPMYIAKLDEVAEMIRRRSQIKPETQPYTPRDKGQLELPCADPNGKLQTFKDENGQKVTRVKNCGDMNPQFSYRWLHPVNMNNQRYKHFAVVTKTNAYGANIVPEAFSEDDTIISGSVRLCAERKAYLKAEQQGVLGRTLERIMQVVPRSLGGKGTFGNTGALSRTNVTGTTEI